eukprot:COSAG06_NODE_60889_length_269_cov_0.911765_1_plen_76_part_01
MKLSDKKRGRFWQAGGAFPADPRGAAERLPRLAAVCQSLLRRASGPLGQRQWLLQRGRAVRETLFCGAILNSRKDF